MTQPQHSLQQQLSLEHQQFTDQIDQKYTKAMTLLQDIHQDINAKFGKLQELKDEYMDIQQKRFLKTFLNIMDKMSTELQQANEAYDCIDQQINEDPKCLYLQKELDFFKGECLNTKKEVEKTKKILEGEKSRNKALIQEREKLKKELRCNTEKHLKYQVRAQSLNREEAENTFKLFTQRKSVVINQKRPVSLSNSRNYSLQLQTRSRHSRKSIEKMPISTAMRTSNSRNQTSKFY